MFNTNVGMFDRVARIVLGVALIAFALGYLAPAAPYHWLGWIGIVPLFTGAFATCPLYSLLGMSTCPVARAR